MRTKINKYACLFSALFLVILLSSIDASAHPGRTDSAGCHTCRTNCASWGLSTGEYHCHKAKSVPQPQEPIKSKYGANGTGYTVPAPEYKVPASTGSVKAEEPKKVETKEEIKKEEPAENKVENEGTKEETPQVQNQEANNNQEVNSGQKEEEKTETAEKNDDSEINENTFSGGEKFFMTISGPIGGVYYFMKVIF